MSFTQRLKVMYSRFSYSGIDDSTPVHLVDRIVYCNLIVLFGTLVNFFGAFTNFNQKYYLLFSINVFYEFGWILGWFLIRQHKYLLARLFILAVLYVGLTVVCAIQGPVVQMEYFFIPYAVLALNMFHPTERKWSWVFGGLCVVSFLFFVQRTEPVFNIDPAQGLYTISDLRANQFMYTAFFVLFLVALSNSFARALKIIDEQRARLFEQNRVSSVGSIACNMAHEINSPLAALDLQIYRLALIFEQNKNNESLQPYFDSIEKIKHLSGRISTVVRGFKQLSLSSETEAESWNSISDLIQPLIGLNHERLKRLNIDLRINTPFAEHQILCRTFAFSQVLLNLINNAIDAMAEETTKKRWIEFETRAVGENFELIIRDAGNMSVSTQARLFEPFFTTKPIGLGKGLGLYISQATVEHHQGRLYFNPSQGHSVFIIELPKDRWRKLEKNSSGVQI